MSSFCLKVWDYLETMPPARRLLLHRYGGERLAAIVRTYVAFRCSSRREGVEYVLNVERGCIACLRQHTPADYRPLGRDYWAKRPKP